MCTSSWILPGFLFLVFVVAFEKRLTIAIDRSSPVRELTETVGEAGVSRPLRLILS
jgi:hypothetical protein